MMEHPKTMIKSKKGAWSKLPWRSRREEEESNEEEEERKKLTGEKKKKREEKEKSTTYPSYEPCGFNELRWWMTWQGHLMNFSSTIPIYSFAATEFSNPIWRRIWLKFYPRVGYRATYPIHHKNKKFLTVKALAADETRFQQLIDFSSPK